MLQTINELYGVPVNLVPVQSQLLQKAKQLYPSIQWTIEFVQQQETALASIHNENMVDSFYTTIRLTAVSSPPAAVCIETFSSILHNFFFFELRYQQQIKRLGSLHDVKHENNQRIRRIPS